MVEASIGVSCGETPSDARASLSSTETLRHTAPCERPSKVTPPIITATTATVPGTGVRGGRPLSGGRIPSRPSRVSQTESRAKRLK
jgi:hypothetical protein